MLLYKYMAPDVLGLPLYGNSQATSNQLYNIAMGELGEHRETH